MMVSLGKTSLLKMLKPMHVHNVAGMTYASSAASVKRQITRVSPNVHLHMAQATQETPTRGKESSLVIMFPFLQAPKHVVERYCDLYHDHGHNVLTVTGTLQHFLWPASGFKLARDVLDYLSGNEIPMTTNNFYIHGFSIGAYIYTLVMMELAKGNHKYASITPKIKAQVFDSLVIGGFDNMSTGMKSVIKNPLLKSLTTGFFNFYLAATKKHTKDILEAAVDHFKTRPIRSPILLYYCLNDSMSRAEVVQQMIDVWQNDYHLDVSVKCWERSIHAGHLRAHPDQYVKTLDAFLTHVQKQSMVPPASKL